MGDQLLIQEARRLARVRHPNVLAVHGSNVDDGRAGIRCDLLRGETLDQVLVRTGCLDPPAFMAIAVPLRLLTTLSVALSVAGDAQASRAIKAEAVTMADRLFPGSLNARAARLNHAVALQELGRFAEAQAGYEQVLAEAEAAHGPDNDEALLARSNLADVFLESGPTEAAERVAREALDHNRRVLGEKHLFTLFVTDVLGASLTRQGRWEEALPLLRRMLAAEEASFGTENPCTQDSAYHPAEAPVAGGQPAEAPALLRGVVRGRCELLGHDHRKTKDAGTLLAAAQGREGKRLCAQVPVR